MTGSGWEGRVEGLCIKESDGGGPTRTRVCCVEWGGFVGGRAWRAWRVRAGWKAIKEMASLRIKQYGRQSRHRPINGALTVATYSVSGMEAWSMEAWQDKTAGRQHMHSTQACMVVVAPVWPWFVYATCTSDQASLQSINPVPCTRPLCPLPLSI